MKRKRKPRPESAQKRLAILAAAARAIAEHGFHGMSIRDLAARTGQVVAGFYHYFSSKDEVLFDIQTSAFETLIATAEDALRGVESPRERLFAFIYQHVRYLAEHTDVMRVLVQEAGTLPPRQRAKVRTLKERYYDLGRAIIADLYRGDAQGGPVDLERATYGTFGMLNWVYGWYEPKRHGTPGEVARSLHRLALSGLTAEYRDTTDIERRLSVVKPLPLLGRGKP
jgi:TetR/AcrR family transcriptional regulator, cholesterol catabolism regulator